MASTKQSGPAHASPFKSLADCIRLHHRAELKARAMPEIGPADFLVRAFDDHDELDRFAEWLCDQFSVSSIMDLTLISTAFTSNRDHLRHGDLILQAITQFMLEGQPRRWCSHPFGHDTATHLGNVVAIHHKPAKFTVIFKK